MSSAKMQETVQQLQESNRKLHNLVQLQTDHMNDFKKQVDQKDHEKLELGEQLDLAKIAKNEAQSKGKFFSDSKPFPSSCGLLLASRGFS